MVVVGVDLGVVLGDDGGVLVGKVCVWGNDGDCSCGGERGEGGGGSELWYGCECWCGGGGVGVEL